MPNKTATTSEEAVEGPLTLEEGVEGIADLLVSPEDEDEEVEAKEESDDDSDEEDLDDEETSEDDEEDDSDEDADEDDEVDEEDDEETEVYEKGRFAADNANVTLADGSTLTVAELKNGNLMQRDYTQKTQALSAERKVFEDRGRQVDEFAKVLNDQRDFLLSVQQYLVPQAPDPALAASDPSEYIEQKAYHEQIAGWMNQAYAQHQQGLSKKTDETNAQGKEDTRIRNQGILEHHSDLKDPKRAKSFDHQFETEFLPHYGFTMDEVKGQMDHRMLSVIRDALRYRKVAANRTKAKAKVEGKPALMKSGRRGNPKQQVNQGRKKRAKQLRDTGNFESGVASLMDLDL